MICPKCSTEQPQESFRGGVCAACNKLEQNRAYHIQKNTNWMELAEEAGIEVYERQPGESDSEYRVWVMYRDMYPAEKPSLKVAAERAGIAYKTIKNMSSKWSFAARMQAWITSVDEMQLNSRRNDIIKMNETHMEMAMTLNEKIHSAINMLDPQYLAPKDISSLMKMSTELERKAKLDQMELVVAGNPNGYNDENPNLRKSEVKTSDIGEIIKILGAAGVMGDFGVKQTTTTEVVVKGDKEQ